MNHSDSHNYTVVHTIDNTTVCRGTAYACARYRTEHANYQDVMLDPDGCIVPQSEQSEILGVVNRQLEHLLNTLYAVANNEVYMDDFGNPCMTEAGINIIQIITNNNVTLP